MPAPGIRHIETLLPAAGPQSVNVSGVASEESMPTLTRFNQSFAVAGVATAEAFGAVTVNQSKPVSGVASEEAFGGVSKANQSFSVSGVATAEAFGSVSITTGPVSV